MNDKQWEILCAVINGEQLHPMPTGFIIDSPWLPNWAGYSILEYFTNDSVWMKTNQKAIETFTQTLFLPGFWSEYGMCTEPSAFGAVSVWAEDEFPFAKPIFPSVEDVDRLEKPNARTDGLLPFVIKRLQQGEPEIQNVDHKIRFAVARGPLNIASFLMGSTEFLMALKTDPERMHRMLTIISEFLVDWIAVQREHFPSIDGVLLLDDIVGFIGKEDFLEFGLPYLKQIYDTDVTVKFFHNDSPIQVSSPYYPEIGINLLNFGIQHSLNEVKGWTKNKITLLGNIPPRDVLANGTPEQVAKATRTIIDCLEDPSRIILSCGGGMPPSVSTENIKALIEETN